MESANVLVPAEPVVRSRAGQRLAQVTSGYSRESQTELGDKDGVNQWNLFLRKWTNNN